jgi:hypothetical protein
MGVSEPELRKDWLKPVFPLDKRFYYQSVARNPGDYQILAHRSIGTGCPATRSFIWRFHRQPFRSRLKRLVPWGSPSVLFGHV